MPEEGQIPVGERRLVIRPRLFAELKKLAHDNETTPTDEMNRAIREMLERESRWPPRAAQAEE
jgi:hypothetical protein